MRNGQQHHHNKRMRGTQQHHNNNNNNNNHRKSHNPLTRVYESNGPDVKIRGTANHVAEKYLQLARDAQSSGDPVSAENYFQHAEHYFRLIAAAQEQFRQNNPNFQPRPKARQRPAVPARQDENFEDGRRLPSRSAEAPFGTREPQPYIPPNAQPFVPRDTQPYQPREAQHGQPPAVRTSRARRSSRKAAMTPCRPSSPAAQRAATAAGAERLREWRQPDRFPLHRRRRAIAARARLSAGRCSADDVRHEVCERRLPSAKHDPASRPCTVAQQAGHFRD